MKYAHQLFWGVARADPYLKRFEKICLLWTLLLLYQQTTIVFFYCPHYQLLLAFKWLKLALKLYYDFDQCSETSNNAEINAEVVAMKDEFVQGISEAYKCSKRVPSVNMNDWNGIVAPKPAAENTELHSCLRIKCISRSHFQIRKRFAARNFEKKRFNRMERAEYDRVTTELHKKHLGRRSYFSIKNGKVFLPDQIINLYSSTSTMLTVFDTS